MPINRADDLRTVHEALSSVVATGADRSRAMPSEFYTSPDVLAVEEDDVFRRDWVCLGHEGEIPAPGDYFTTELFGEQLLVVRDDGGTVRVLSNVCRHRGNLVAEGRGSAKLFVCRYHAWTYRTDGSLRSAPLMKTKANFDAAECGLPSFPVEVWQRFIFVNLEGNASPLAPRLGPIDALIKNYHHAERNLLFKTEARWETNWKCLVENFMEGYHLSATHIKTLHKITPTRLCEKLEGGDAFTAYRAHYDPDCPDRGPYHDDLTETERRNTPLFCVYPNLLVAVATHYTLFLCVRPAGTDAVDIRWGVTGFSNDPEAQNVKDYVALCEAFNAEDREKLEALTLAQKSRYYTPGPLAPANFEGTIWDFYNYIAKRFGHEPIEDRGDTRQSELAETA